MIEQDDPPIGSVWKAYHMLGEDIVLVVSQPTSDGPKRRFVKCFVLSTGLEIETWLANFTVWDRLL